MKVLDVETPPAPGGPPADAGIGRELPEGKRAALVALLPSSAAVVALLVHRYLPDQQILPMSWIDELPAWRHPYPVLLWALLAASLAVAMAQYSWRRLRLSVRQNAPLWAGAFAGLTIWELMTQKLNWLPLPFFPGPDLVLAGMINDRTILLQSTYQSLKLLAAGYLTGIFAGLASGVLMGWFRRVRYWGMPVLKVLGPIPATALIPLAMMLFSDSFVAGMALIAAAVWFPVTMLTTSGIANVPASYFDVARTLGAGRGYLIFRVALPAALPSIFIGFFMGLGAAFLTLIVAETVGVEAGLGWYLQWQKGYAEYANVYAALVIMAAFFSGLMTLLFHVRDRVLGWQKGLIRW
jgi:sulfonate transport system permease protein